MLPLLFLGDTGSRVLIGQTLSSDFNTSVARQLVLHLGVTVPLILAMLTSVAAGPRCIGGHELGFRLSSSRSLPY